MRVLVNAAAALPGTSAETYLGGMLAALMRARPGWECTVILSADQPALASALPDGVRHRSVALPRSRVLRGLRLQTLVRRLVRETRADVLYNVGNFFVWRSGCHQVCLIENMSVFSRSPIRWDARGRLRNRILRRLTRAALGRADLVIFPSERAAVLATRLARGRAPSLVIHHGCAPSAGAREAPGPPFVLCVSSFYPFKNLPLLVRGFAIFREVSGYAGPLVIVGHQQPDTGVRQVREAAAAAGVQDHVRLVPPVTPGVLAGYYRAADALVMPSLEESFGLPVLEAMTAGCPVVAADVALGDRPGAYFNPFPEICADAAEYFDPFDARSLAGALGRAVGGRASLAARGRARAASFTWERAAEALAAGFEQAAAS